MFVCFSDNDEEAPRGGRPRADTAAATNGRVLRILIVGPDDEKQQVLDDMRSMYGRMGGGSRAVSVGTTITHVENYQRKPAGARPRVLARASIGDPGGRLARASRRGRGAASTRS